MRQKSRIVRRGAMARAQIAPISLMPRFTGEPAESYAIGADFSGP